jgi:hypothetical protein
MSKILLLVTGEHHPFQGTALVRVAPAGTQQALIRPEMPHSVKPGCFGPREQF